MLPRTDWYGPNPRLYWAICCSPQHLCTACSVGLLPTSKRCTYYCAAVLAVRTYIRPKAGHAAGVALQRLHQLILHARAGAALLVHIHLTICDVALQGKKIWAEDASCWLKCLHTSCHMLRHVITAHRGGSVDATHLGPGRRQRICHHQHVSSGSCNNLGTPRDQRGLPIVFWMLSKPSYKCFLCARVPQTNSNSETRQHAQGPSQ